ncbi:hypothetical protein E4U17_004866 [Claviceps sp. LM77 group G4]|nr:hypothetical protein E4U17_004866 [Claviceps sp. LM77 group G4]KAG6073116.1 hypothetical protein E4U33_003020 [Claviceps sp. LM78 group G4]KAG6078330.1 hypothetical protein E4U16_001721 [Claviceps sp. LM84 group G4]
MDPGASPPGSSAGGPLQPATPERVNRQDPLFSPLRSENRDNVVHDKISQFNNMSIAMQSKQLERKTADAALKRAMLGREEAEADAKRLREENRLLRKEVEGGNERERKVGERLEAVMENYGRAKETHAHTQALWEKEIRRARKENFKSQSAIVKLQEELKSARATNKTIAESLEREKERSKVREQEAFTARYQIVGVQEQLDKALEHIKIVEQERDAFKTAAKNEEVARIAAEGRLPLPVSNDPIEEPESPEKERIKYLAPPKRGKGQNAHRVSLSTMEIMSSAASEMEIEELNTKVLWERQRANRAQEMIEFLQAECQMHLCSCSRDNNSRKSLEAPQKRRRMSMEQEDQKRRRLSTEDEEHTILVKEGTASPAHSQRAAAQSCSGSPRLSLPRSPLREEQEPSQPEPAVKLAYEPIATPTVEARPEYEPVVEQGAEKKHPRLQHIKSKKEPRRSTIFCRKEGIFRTVSEQEAAAFEAAQEEAAQKEAVMTSAPAVQEQQTPATAETERSPRNYARTPSVEPPTFALIGRPERNSLDFLLLENLNDDDAQSRPVSPPSIPTAASDEPARTSVSSLSAAAIQPRKRTMSPRESLVSRAHSASTSSFTVTTTVPLREDTARSSSAFNERLRTPSHGSTASFDSSDPAMTPTMTREQALAKIRERRGRARSAAQAATTSSGRKAVGGGGAATTTTATTTTTGPRGRALKRDMSAPMAKTTPRIK